MAEGQFHRVAHPRPLVALVGRPNVGKSTLFNRLVRARWAITDSRPGVTRDCLYARTEWQGRPLTLVDTGGFVPRGKDALEVAVRTQAELAIAEADMVLLVCDARAGLTDLDRELAEVLRQQQRPCLVVINKVDGPEGERELDEFFRLGMGRPIAVSAATGRHTGDLLEAIVEHLVDQEYPVDPAEDEAIKVALAGRPNVGKSTLINRLAGYRVSIVHEQPGTTRDTTRIKLLWKDRLFLLMDTAGLRRRARIEDAVEFYSSRRALQSIEKADVVVVLLDAVEGWTLQDARIVGQVLEAGCGLVVAVNKWDRSDRREQSSEEFAASLRDRFPLLVDYPIVFISALTGSRVQQCLEWVAQVSDHRQTRIQTAKLNAFFERLTRQYPAANSGEEIKVFYATQCGVAPPTFSIFANYPERISAAHRRSIEKRMRDEFGLVGTPLRLVWRRRRRPPGGRG